MPQTGNQHGEEPLPAGPGERLSRRSFLSISAPRVLAAGLSLALGAGAYGVLLEPGWLRLERPRVAIRHLPLGLSGFTIGHLTDLHLGPYVGEKLVKRAVDLLMSCRPDLIVLTGDFVCRRSRGISTGVLSGLMAPHGVFAVLGNHDYWHGAGPIISSLERDGIRVLVNDSQRIEANGCPLWIAGLDDCWEGRPDLDAALHGIPPDEPRVLLVHEPDYADRIGNYRVDLQLSGHSHGGQVRLPLVGAPILPVMGRRYPQGLALANRTLVYTSRGVGMIPPPIRLNCRPEVTVLELSRGPD